MSGGALRIGLTGLGGFSAYMCERMLAEGRARDPSIRLDCVCEPELERFPERVWQLQEAGVTLVSKWADLLDRPIDAVCLPLPIDLHLRYTQEALAAGKAVLCEKPAAGCIDDVDAMIQARDAAGLPVAIGFQDVYQPAVHEVKRRLLRGDFGVVLSATVLGCWPRGQRYYRRNTWAGKLRRNGRWVLDSPANNALAHYIHLAMFLLGPSERASAVPDEVEAELYRVNPIESYDTCSLRLTFDGGAHALIALTHACEHNSEPQVIIRTDGARIRYVSSQHIEIDTDSVTEKLALSRNPHGQMFRTLLQWLRQGPDSAPGGSLEMARAHALAVSAATQASAIHDIPGEFVEPVLDDKGAPLRAVRGIADALRLSIEDGRMLHESGLVGWSAPAGDIDTRGYSHFEGPAAARPVEKPSSVPSAL